MAKNQHSGKDSSIAQAWCDLGPSTGTAPYHEFGELSFSAEPHGLLLTLEGRSSLVPWTQLFAEAYEDWPTIIGRAEAELEARIIQAEQEHI